MRLKPSLAIDRMVLPVKSALQTALALCLALAHIVNPLMIT